MHIIYMYKLAIIIILSIAIGYFIFRNNSISEGMNGIEGLTNDEAVQNIASLYNQGKMSVTNLDVTNNTNTKDLNVSGAVKIGDKLYVAGATDQAGSYYPGAINIPAAATIASQGRMHIMGPELLYLLNKDGVIVGKAWGGNGNLHVEGRLSGPTIDSKTDKVDQRFDNMHCSGWDLHKFKSTGEADCVAGCKGVHGALSCLYKKSDKGCWCKSIRATGGRDSNYVTTIFAH
ncbi:MAG: hypothetical protein ACFFKA_06675 [Candidatus Thorarchaeota archaeon]